MLLSKQRKKPAVQKIRLKRFLPIQEEMQVRPWITLIEKKQSG
mgnify:CR=1 FL=1